MTRTPLSIVGAAYTAVSVNFSAQRCVNLYVEIGEAGSRSPAMLVGRPGLVRRYVMPNAPAPIRGMQEFRGDLWVVSGNKVYRIPTTGIVREMGTLSTKAGPVSIQQNESQIGFVDGVNGYYYDVPSATFGQILDADYPSGAKVLSYMDGRFIVEVIASQQFQWSDIGNIRAWNGLNFGSAEGSPDNIVSHIVDHRQLYLLGSSTTEIDVTTANGIERSGNAFMEQGCAAAFSPASVGNGVMWLGSDKTGQGIVWQTQGGYNPQRVSTAGVEVAIASYARIDDARAYSFQWRGHLFYVLNFPAADATWCYDAATQEWHELVYFDSMTGAEHRYRGECHTMYQGEHMIGDYANGLIYTLSDTAYTDDGNPIYRLRSTACVTANQLRMFFESLQIGIESGVGTDSGPGSDPKLLVRWSDDGGHTWSNRRQVSMGKKGQYGLPCRIFGLGSGHNRVWEFSVIDPVKTVLMDAFMEVEIEGW